MSKHKKILKDLEKYVNDVGKELGVPAEEDIDQALNKENIKDGLHYIEGENEGYTTTEINQLIIKYDFNNDNLNEALEKIRIFFPQCEIGELNTGDY